MIVNKKYHWARAINSAYMQIMPLMSGADGLPFAIKPGKEVRSEVMLFIEQPSLEAL
jgi:hypothetical protein